MKFNTQNLALVIVFQLILAGATLSITATNAGAADDVRCSDPEASFYIPDIAEFQIDESTSVEYSDRGEYLTLGEVSALDFRNECKNYTNFRKVFRDEIKTTNEKCSGIGEVC